MSKQQFIQDLVKPVILAMGYDFWGLKLATQGRKTYLQIFIDKKTGINLEHCQEVAIQLSTLLDVEDPIRGKYELEISSPGLDRELFNLKQCKAYQKKKVKVRLFHQVLNRRNFVATIHKVDLDNEIIEFVEEDGAKFKIDYCLIKKISLRI